MENKLATILMAQYHLKENTKMIKRMENKLAIILMEK
jgi:hypothetical protein